MHKPLLLIMLGLPGSGKTYFSSRIAAELPAVWLNSDGVRAAMFEKPREITDPKLRYDAVFGAIDHVTQQVLATGTNVIYDANNHKRHDRDRERAFAAQHNAIGIVVHVIAPREVADHRAQTRETSNHHLQMSAESLAKHHASIQLPQPDEATITIDGTTDFSEQFKNFKAQLRDILGA